VGMASTQSLLAFFCFWEVMSSWPLFFAIIHEESPAALKEVTAQGALGKTGTEASALPADEAPSSLESDPPR